MQELLEVSKEEVNQVFQEMMGPQNLQEEARKMLGEEGFQRCAETIRHHSELVALRRKKWGVNPKTVLGMLGYYLDAIDMEYEKAGNGFYVETELGTRSYPMHFLADEKNRQVVLTYDLEEPIPAGKKRWIVSRFLSKINNMHYNEGVRLRMHDGHVRWKLSWTLLSETMHYSAPYAMIESILASFKMVYPALMAILHDDADLNEAIEMVINSVPPVYWILLDTRHN